MIPVYLDMMYVGVVHADMMTRYPWLFMDDILTQAAALAFPENQGLFLEYSLVGEPGAQSLFIFPLVGGTA